MEKLRKIAWEAMLTADLNHRYFDALAGKFYKHDLYTKIFLAAMSSGTVAGWAFWKDNPCLWKTLSGISAVLAIALPILNYPKKLEAAGRLKTDYDDIKRDYQLLWARIDNNTHAQTENELKRIFQKEGKLATLESTVPGNDKKLNARCQQEVLKANGLLA
jgi:hypothetical protein